MSTSECDIYEEPGQTCLTAGQEVIAAEGICGPCTAKFANQAWREGVTACVCNEDLLNAVGCVCNSVMRRTLLEWNETI